MIAAVAGCCVLLPPWSATHAIAPHFVFAYALALMLLWVPVLHVLRPNTTTTDALMFASLASGLLALSHATHANMLLLGHAVLFSVGAAAQLGRFVRFGHALQFMAALGVYAYAAGFLLRAIILN